MSQAREEESEGDTFKLWNFDGKDDELGENKPLLEKQSYSTTSYHQDKDASSDQCNNYQTSKVMSLDTPVNSSQNEEIIDSASHLIPKIGDVPPQRHQRGRSEFSFFTTSEKHRKRRAGHGNHRRQSSLAQILGTLGSGLGTILEDVQHSAHDIRRTWDEEMEIANESGFIFLESSLIRSFSVLPEDMEQLVEQMPKPPDTSTMSFLPFDSSVDLGPYLSLLGAVLAVSSNGTALTLQHDVPPPLKLYWRMIGTSLLLFPFAMRLMWIEGLPRLNIGQWGTVAFAVACYVIHNLCFITALTYTSIGNSVLFANTQALILLAAKALTGDAIHWMEYTGAVVAFTGAILCATDEERVTATEVSRDAAWGDLLAMMSAVFGVGYLTFAKAVRPSTSVVTFMFIVMFAGSFMVLLYLAVTSTHTTANMHPLHGLFGWLALRNDRLPLELWIVVVCNLVGTMGFVRSMQYFDSLIIAISTLLEPIVASVIASIMHVGVLPGCQGWVGNILVIVGTFGVVYPSASKGESGGH
jgi:drug/metabolite transporter (DMT)-like permease